LGFIWRIFIFYLILSHKNHLVILTLFFINLIIQIMKKILTFSLVALLAVAGFAKIKPNAQKAYRPHANVELSSKQYTTAKESKAVLASKPERMLKGNRLVQPKDAYPYNANYGASFERPLNSFFSSISTKGYSLMYKHIFAMPFTTLTFENTSTDLFDWAYTDPDTEDELTSDATNLTLEVGEYNLVGAPVLTMPGVPTDTVYTIAEYMKIAGDAFVDWTEDNAGWLGASNYNPDWDGFYYSTRYYAANVPSVNSTYTQEYAEYGVDTVKIVGYAELMNKPTSPYILYDVAIPMLVAQAGDLTLAVYKAVQDEEGNWELGDRLSAEVTVNFKEANMGAITYAEFKDLVYEDPETGLEETLVIDDPVFVMLTTSVQNHPLFFYHDEPLPLERHAFNLMDYTIDGEEYEMLDDVNYAFTNQDGSSSYMSAFAFAYNIEMCYLHNNDETDTFNAPVEGGDKTFNISSMYSSSVWEVTDTEYQDIPDWITVEFEDGTVEQNGTLYYNGETDATFTVAALPEGVDYRSADVMLSYDGAKCIIHVTQGDAAQPVYYLVGTFNGWSQQEGLLEFVENEDGVLEAAAELEANAEFKVITPNGDGWTWYGGQDDNQVGYFLINDGLMNVAINLVDGANFRIEKAGKYTFQLDPEAMTLTVVPEAAPVVPGDVDGDGHVTAGDITLLYNVMLNNDYTGVVNGDQDGDGNITAGDVTFIYNILLGTE
jgi:hypothetical protein